MENMLRDGSNYPVIKKNLANGLDFLANINNKSELEAIRKSCKIIREQIDEVLDYLVDQEYEADCSGNRAIRQRLFAVHEACLATIHYFDEIIAFIDYMNAEE